ncbi:MAG: hypothetical protein Q9222_000374 [Ikaeria aurantiellina]
METLMLLVKASRMVTLEDAQRDIATIMHNRLSNASAHAQRLLPKDVRELIAMHSNPSSDETTRKRKATSKEGNKAYRPAKLRNTGEEQDAIDQPTENNETNSTAQSDRDEDQHDDNEVPGNALSSASTVSSSPRQSTDEVPNIEKARSARKPLVPSHRRFTIAELDFLDENSPASEQPRNLPSFSDILHQNDDFSQTFALPMPDSAPPTPDTSEVQVTVTPLPQRWVSKIILDKDFTPPQPPPEPPSQQQGLNPAQFARNSFDRAVRELEDWRMHCKDVKSALDTFDSMLEEEISSYTTTLKKLATAKGDHNILKNIIAQYSELSPAMHDSAQVDSLEAIFRTASDRIEEVTKVKVARIKICTTKLEASHELSIQSRCQAETVARDALAECQGLERSSMN